MERGRREGGERDGTRKEGLKRRGCRSFSFFFDSKMFSLSSTSVEMARRAFLRVLDAPELLLLSGSENFWSRTDSQSDPKVITSCMSPVWIRPKYSSSGCVCVYVLMSVCGESVFLRARVYEIGRAHV